MSESGVTPLVRLRPELLEDVTEAYSWYESRAEGVGMDFTRAFYAADLVRAVSLKPLASCMTVLGACDCAVSRIRFIIGLRRLKLYFFSFFTALAIPVYCIESCKRDEPTDSRGQLQFRLENDYFPPLSSCWKYA